MMSTCIAVLLEAEVRPTVKFSEDVIPLGDLKVNPGKVLRRADETGRPILLTSHGRGVAVVQGLADFEAAQEERDFMRAVVAGLTDLEEGRELSFNDAKRRLGLS
jgi:prevent-host-death family protein